MTKEAIKEAFASKLVGNAKMQAYVLTLLTHLPETVAFFVTQHVWFVASFDDAWAFTFVGSDFGNKHVIFLSDELLTQNDRQIYWTICHEIGHVILGHKNRFTEKFGKEIIDEQEKEADAFAEKYLN